MADLSIRLVEAVVHGRALVVSSGDGGRSGLLVGFHGYAEDAVTQLRRLERIQRSSAWALVSIQGLNRFYRGRSEEVVAGWMTRQDRDSAIADNIAYVDRVLDSLERFDGPIVYAGFSQGVAMAFRAALCGRRAPAGVMAVGGDVPPELLSGSADSSRTIREFPPVLLARGARDEWYTQAKLDADVRHLLARGSAVTPFVFDGGHEWTAAVDGAATDFLRRVQNRSCPDV